MKNKNNIIQLTSVYDYERIVPELLQKLRQNEITDFIIIYNEKPSENNPGSTHHYWFAEGNVIYILGLIRRMGMFVEDFLREHTKISERDN